MVILAEYHPINSFWILPKLIHNTAIQRNKVMIFANNNIYPFFNRKNNYKQ